jgi:exopolyphosphatase/guanosine-5'-triphosphate,3'-diphosphate pyrophosphatase
VAAIDCGTNSLRLLVVERFGGERLRRTEIVRLGQGVDRTGRLAPEALERTRRVLVEFAAALRSYDVDAVRMVATSATREAANRAQLADLVHDVLGIEPDVIRGEEEAALSFAGAVDGLPQLRGTLLVADIGGGSTELIVGSADRADASWARSVDVGSVRLTERHLRDDPPTPGQIETTVAHIRAAIADVPWHHAGTVVGLAGTVTTLASIAGAATALHGARLPTTTVDEITDRLLAMPRAQRAAIPTMHPGRADVIAAGALIVRTLLHCAGAAELVVSVHDLLDGITAALLAD